jgi:hypothetical protein
MKTQPIQQIVISINEDALENIAGRISALARSFSFKDSWQTGSSYFIEEYIGKHIQKDLEAWAKRNINNISDLQAAGLYKFVAHYLINKGRINKLAFCNRNKDVIFN